MRGGTDKPPQELTRGDILESGGQRFEVIGEPFLGSVGASLFDSFGLFWRVRLRSLDERSDVRYMTWPVGTRVAVTPAPRHD